VVVVKSWVGLELVTRRESRINTWVGRSLTTKLHLIGLAVAVFISFLDADAFQFAGGGAV
jgi:hypothetical protein